MYSITLEVTEPNHFEVEFEKNLRSYPTAILDTNYGTAVITVNNGGDLINVAKFVAMYQCQVID